MLRQRTSVATILIVALVAATTLVLGLFGLFSYRANRTQAFDALHRDEAILADQLSVALALPVWNFDRDQIDRIIESAMNNRNVAGVVVRLADSNSTIHARTRDERWTVQVSPGGLQTNGLLVVARNINADKEVLGSVSVLVTPKFIMTELRRSGISMIVIVLLLDAILVLSLYWLLWQLMLKPLQTIGRYAEAVNSGVGQPTDLPGSFRGELDHLRNSIERMIELLSIRYAAMEESDQQLRTSEERFRSALQHSPIGMALATPDGRWLEVNPALCHITGYSREELQASDYQSITHPEDLAADRTQLHQMLTRQIESYQLEKRYLHKDGQVIWIQLNISLVWNPDGTPRHFVTQIQDITKRKLAEAERLKLLHDLGERVKELTALHRTTRLLQQERPFNQQLLSELVAFLPPAWQFPEICEARVAYATFEARTARWRETPWKQLVQFATSGDHAGIIEVVYLEQRPAEAEGPFLAEERTLIQSLADMLAAYLERKHAEQALRDNRAKLVLAMEMAKLAHWEYDVASNRFTFDDDFYRLFGTTAAREGGTFMLLETYARKFIPPEETTIVLDELKRTITTTDPQYSRQLEHRFVRADGSPGVMSVRIAIVKDAAGRTIKTYGANQDITEQKHAEEKQRELEGQLRQAQKLEALGTLAGGIAHDFNNILGAIISFTELARMDNPDNAELQDNLQQVLKASGRATNLVRQILSFSRQQKQERKSLQLAPVVKEALKLLRSTLPTTIDMQQVVDGDLPNVLADPTQIHQVIMNLCTNAGHAMRGRQGRLRILLDRLHLGPTAPKPHVDLREGDYVRLEISDTGHGIDEPTLKRIFEPFFTTKAPGEGTGLGLSVVHGIIMEHDGIITVDSEPGRGTTFKIYLPALSAAAAGEIVDGTKIPRGHGEHVMFVDDETVQCDAAQKLISRLGYQPVVFSSPEAAWNAIQTRAQSFDLVVTDLTMPVMTGIDLARKLHGLRPELPIILTSGYSGSLTLQAVHEVGVIEIVHKPLDYRSLGLSIHRVLNRVPSESRSARKLS